MRFARIPSFLLFLGAGVLPVVETQAQAPAIPDSITFAMVAKSWGVNGDSAPLLRVDPRPLASDPTLVTFAGLGSLAPPGVSGQAPKTPLISDSALANARRRTLERLGLTPADLLADLRCDSRRLSRLPEDVGCIPGNGFYSLAIGLPRAGGPYAPGIVDERNAYDGREVVSVRVISRMVMPDGSTEFSADFVYERLRDGSVVFLKRVRLFWIG